jgi:hypothetical protein
VWQTKLYLEMGEMNWKAGAMSGAVYDGSPELGSLMSKARKYKLYNDTVQYRRRHLTKANLTRHITVVT